MSYTITLTNGNKLSDIVDGSIDQSATDLTLIGKNISNYGTFLNDNFVRLLENFSNDTEPSQPIIGQLWYDTSENLLKVYTGLGFAPTGNTLVSASEPSSLNAGGLWINSDTEQLFFNDGLNTVLAGPIYTASQGRSGFIVSDVIDVNQGSHTIVKLYVAEMLIGIFSKDPMFTPETAITGYTGAIYPGFNTGSNADLLYDLQASSALALVDSNGDPHTTDEFVSSTSMTPFINGTLSILNDIPVIFGSGGELQIEINSSIAQIKSKAINQDLQITTRRTGTAVYDPAIYMQASNQRVGIFTDTPTATLDVNGDTIIRGNLTIEGSTTSVNSTNLVIEDKLIELGKVGTPTNVTANGGGIKLLGASDKTFAWNSATSAWDSSESINVTGSTTYKIAGTTVLSATALGAGVSSSSLTSVGHLTDLTAAWIGISSNTISYVNSGSSNGDVVISPKGTGSVDVDTSKIINVSTPVSGTDAANKNYVDSTVKSAPIAISLNTGVLDNTGIATTYLNIIFPSTEHANGTVCRAVCTNSGGTVSIKNYTLNTTSSTWVYQYDY